MRYIFKNPYDPNICPVARSKVTVGWSAMARAAPPLFARSTGWYRGQLQSLTSAKDLIYRHCLCPRASTHRSCSPCPLPVPAPHARSPIVRILAPQAANTPRKGSIYVLSTPDDLILVYFGLLQDCQLMTAIMVQFLEMKHRSKKIIFPNFLILTERLDLCYARPLREGQAVDCRFEQYTLKKPKFDRF
jgi:hypothetical protein